MNFKNLKVKRKGTPEELYGYLENTTSRAMLVDNITDKFDTTHPDIAPFLKSGNGVDVDCDKVVVAPNTWKVYMHGKDLVIMANRFRILAQMIEKHGMGKISVYPNNLKRYECNEF